MAKYLKLVKLMHSKIAALSVAMSYLSSVEDHAPKVAIAGMMQVLRELRLISLENWRGNIE